MAKQTGKLTEAQRNSICDAFLTYLEAHKLSLKKCETRFNQAASLGTLSKISNHEFDGISDEKMRLVGTLCGWSEANGNWKTVETRDYQLLDKLLRDCKNLAFVLAVTGAAGSGKTHCLDVFARDHHNVYVIQCREYWNRKQFLREFLRVLGRSSNGLTVEAMMDIIIHILKSKKDPVVVFDEADKLSEATLYFFITLYNTLQGVCGMMMIATDFLEKRIRNGLDYNKKGYQEIYSRLGRKFIQLNGVNKSDVRAVCVANGVSDAQIITEIYKDSSNDLRRVKRRVQAEIMKAEEIHFQEMFEDQPLEQPA